MYNGWSWLLLPGPGLAGAPFAIRETPKAGSSTRFQAEPSKHLMININYKEK
jgi:hypothetical protein